MGVMIVRFGEGNGNRWGRIVGDAPTAAQASIDVVPLDTRAETTADLIAAVEGNRSLLDAGVSRHILGSALRSPITTNARLLCQGLNYRDHAVEAGHHERKQNLLFTKASSSLSGPYDAVRRPANTQLLDYEAEIGVVLRSDLRPTQIIGNDTIGEVVAGVVLCNDVSARDTMFGASFFQWFEGKSAWTFCPAGPVLYLLDRGEVAATLEHLELKLWLNGDARQSAVSSNLIYKPAETLTHIASFMSLSRGDVILTGTPGGVIAQGSPKLFDILKNQLHADIPRRDAMRAELLASATFLKPGDKMTLSLRDGHAGLDLGRQDTMVIQSE
jgi:2-keto-4-pentenoate hydratase/2-oxohepta-3-ene-1,7-dioic acid hydratase in catechol pathway